MVCVVRMLWLGVVPVVPVFVSHASLLAVGMLMPCLSVETDMDASKYVMDKFTKHEVDR